MMPGTFSRRRFLAAQGAFALTAAAGTRANALLAHPVVAAADASTDTSTDTPTYAPSVPPQSDADRRLDTYIARYMPAMNAPGLSLGLTDAHTTLRVAGYGLSDIARRQPVRTSHLFQIGSITKSFVAIVLLQLREEGKVDFNQPVLDYLPWLPIETSFGVITTHHLLTHTSGLPDDMDLFLTDPQARHAQGFKPGEHFHYCNLGFAILGHLIAKLDGRPWRRAVQSRIFDKLAMTESVGVITTASRDRSATGHVPFYDDLEYWRQGRLTDAGNLVMDDTAGCIASTPGDMAKYMRMLLNAGQDPQGPIISDESFALFSKPYIAAEEFSPTASYGYGIAVDTLDGHKILRHTGGMISFASSINVDLDAGVAAFASINAMQGYRPIAVTEYAVRLLRAVRESRSLPDLPKLKDPAEIDNAADYAGTYTTADGKSFIVEAHDKTLTLVCGGTRVALQSAGDDTFLAAFNADQSAQQPIDRELSEFTFFFGRAAAKPSGDAGSKPSGEPNPAGKIVELSHGPNWYTRENYHGPREFPAPADYPSYVGTYRAESPWAGTVRVVLRKGKLWLETTTLVPLGNGLFRAGEESWSPDRIEFLHVVEGKARLLKLEGMDCWRVEVE